MRRRTLQILLSIIFLYLFTIVYCYLNSAAWRLWSEPEFHIVLLVIAFFPHLVKNQVTSVTNSQANKTSSDVSRKFPLLRVILVKWIVAYILLIIYCCFDSSRWAMWSNYRLHTGIIGVVLVIFYLEILVQQIINKRK